MMAKRKENRYNDIEELLTDLEALRQGQSPLQAHRRFDVSMLEQLEKGDAVEIKEEGYKEETVAQYRMAILILSTLLAVFFVIILLMWLT